MTDLSESTFAVQPQVSLKPFSLLAAFSARSSVGYFLALLPIAILVTLMFSEGLFHGKTILHGDSVIHGLPVLSFHSAVLAGQQDMLWTDEMFMGHPIYAEGQIAFFSPLTTLVALLFTPTTAMTVLHWLSMIISAAGVIALCRQLNLSFAASSLAALVVTFSGIWILCRHNITISGTVAWLPWMIWAFEKWIRKPQQIAALVVFTSITIFSGYPQIVHGAAVYGAVLFLVSLVASPERTLLLKRLPRYFGFALLAILLCLGLTAIQTVPLAELVSFSQRQSGIDINSIFQPPAENILRGAAVYSQGSSRAIVDFLGSPTACFLLVALIGMSLVRWNSRILGHFVAGFVLANLAAGKMSPLFNLVYDYELLPGLRYFRMYLFYLMPTVVGVGVVVGFVADKLATTPVPRAKYLLLLSAAVLASIWIFQVLQLKAFSVIHFWLFGASIVTALLVMSDRWRTITPYLFIAIMVVEIIALKFNSFSFYPRELVKEPDTVAFVKSESNFADYKVFDVTHIDRAAITPGNDRKRVEYFALNMLHNFTPSTNLLWGLSNAAGAHALPLSRSTALQKIINQEIEIAFLNDPALMPASRREGLRFMDYYGIKYVAADTSPPSGLMALRFTSLWRGIQIYENPYARPRYQTYTAFEFAKSTQDALSAIQWQEEPRLIIEPEGKLILGVDAAAAKKPNNPTAISFSALKSTATEHVLTINATEAGWFFLADANFPGWKASLDQRPVQVFTAQLLGKAIWIPQGQYLLRIWFDSYAYKMGRVITLCACAIALVLLAISYSGALVRGWRTKKSKIASPIENGTDGSSGISGLSGRSG